ncbi:MAG: Hsp20/alpha crystallin family protein [Candidatus ainarchaeum sp.]|nr:Hsp20/alpha crystallin family protein [Candidatus ainarchaeum sp.]
MARGKKGLPDFFGDFHRLQDEMERMLRDFDYGRLKEGRPLVYGFNVRVGPEGEPVIEEFGNVKAAARAGGAAAGDAREPLVDLIERRADVTVMAELPGVEKKDVRLKISGNVMVVEAGSGGEARYYREVELPAKVKTGGAKASYKNGVLEVVLKKVKSSKPRATALKIE